jgi:hypothetical protein
MLLSHGVPHIFDVASRSVWDASAMLSSKLKARVVSIVTSFLTVSMCLCEDVASWRW